VVVSSRHESFSAHAYVRDRQDLRFCPGLHRANVAGRVMSLGHAISLS
jgi:hypothetical protein